MDARLSFVHVLSALHPGTGQGTGVIDLPVAREKATGIPFLPGSSLKGALRTRCHNNGSPEKCRDIFGSADPLEDNNTPSMAQFSDQRLLLLPMRSLAGTFAWVTSPYVLRRLLRDMEEIGIEPPAPVLPVEEPEQCYISFGKCAIVPSGAKDNKVYLEDLDLSSERKAEITSWAEWIGKQLFPSEEYWQTMLVERFCLVHDDVFNFMLNTATEVIARIKLEEEAKTVVQGGLWYEEALPAETILTGTVLATPTRNLQTRMLDMQPAKIFETLEELMQQTIQLGGNATVGRGMCRVRLAGKGV
jgi:CRISPR-associated protein Cmr4